jgi:2-oxoglutarate dehydrogenase complex dehydrogenase (E1) component-like enzyme
VVEGIVRAKRDVLDHRGTSFPVLPVQMHGDAAFACQSMVAETFAISSLLLDGHPLRSAGQDSRRGAFGRRHAVLIDRGSGES